MTLSWGRSAIVRGLLFSVIGMEGRLEASATPAATAPATPAGANPATPAAPGTPAATAPSTPAATAPSTPAGANPATPAATAPATPAATAPATPAATAPSTPAGASPATPAAPGTPAATAPAPVAKPPGTTRAWLNRHLELHAQALVPVGGLWEGGSQPTGRGVWNQVVGGGSVTVRPIEHVFATLTLLAYTRPESREAWTPDFTYIFGYDDWRPFKFYFTHSNYTGTHYPWRATPSDPIARVSQGVTTAGWRYQLPVSWRESLELGPDWWAGGSIAVHYAARYGLAGGGEGYHQAYGSVGLSLTWREHLFGEFRAYAYPIPGQQQPWDPDFTYSLGWMDWRPWRVTVRWNNYGGNRWPGHALEGNGALSRGALVMDVRLGF